MPSQDAERWNRRYREEHYRSFEEPRPFINRHADILPSYGLALDAAMGLGNNASFLLERGLRVIGVDISDVAVRSARQRLPGLMAVIADLSSFYFPPNTFDVLLNSYFLIRSLWPLYKYTLKPGGLLFFEAMTIDTLQTRPDIDANYLLQHGELLEGFRDFEILHYHEGWETGGRGHSRSVASLIARKP